MSLSCRIWIGARYFTYNSLGAWLPSAPTGNTLAGLGRQAFLGVFLGQYARYTEQHRQCIVRRPLEACRSRTRDSTCHSDSDDTETE